MSVGVLEGLQMKPKRMRNGSNSWRLAVLRRALANSRVLHQCPTPSPTSQETCLGRRVPRALARRLVDVVLPPTRRVGLRPPTSTDRARSLGRRLGPVPLGGCRDEHRRFSFPVILRQDAPVAGQKIILQVFRQRLRLVQQDLMEAASLS